MPVLGDDEVRQALSDLSGWELSESAAQGTPGIVRELRFSGFPDAVAFVVRLSFEAEAVDHHPDVDIRYNRVRVVLSTHSEGGVTAKDLELARAIQRLA